MGLSSVTEAITALERCFLLPFNSRKHEGSRWNDGKLKKHPVLARPGQ